MEKSIAEKRSLIRDCNEEMEILKASYQGIEKADKQMQELENGESSIGECLKEVTALLSPLQCGSLSDWNGIITDKKGRIEKLPFGTRLWRKRKRNCKR